MGRTVLYISFISLFSLQGCLFGPNDVRTNTYDPKSPYFAPNFSQPVIHTNRSDNDIYISWRNESEYGSGFFIDKKLEKSYKRIDTLYSGSSYVDSTKKYSVKLKYRVTSILENEYGILEEKVSKETEEISFGQIHSAAVFRSQNSIAVRWFDGSHFDDKTTIEYRKRGNNKWREIFSTGRLTDEYQIQTFEIPVDQEYDFRISMFLMNHKGVFEKFDENVLKYGY